MIRLGYEIGSGRPVDIPSDRHVAISGQTQRSGKTTTLEALIHRASHRQDGSENALRAVAFVTKRAEGSFRSAQKIAPYFRDSADWQFVSSILEAMMGERMKFERSWIIDACRGADGLAGVLANVQKRLHGEINPAYTAWRAQPATRGKKKTAPPEYRRKPASGLNASVLTSLEAYLDIVIPQINLLPYTKTLELAPGLNVMDLSDYSTELQQLVIRSVLEWVYERETHTIVVIPEAWEFIPQSRRSPVLLAAEELIRKGAAAGNFVWLDSQDIAGVHKNVLRSVGVWILGVQRELNEVKRTLAYVQGGGRVKPESVMALGKGQFYAAWDTHVSAVYVQPFWISDAHAAAIARGEETVESAEKIWRERQQNSRPGRHPGAAIDGAAERGHASPVPPDRKSDAPLAGGEGRKVLYPSPLQLLQIQEQTPHDESNDDSAPMPLPGSHGPMVGNGVSNANPDPHPRRENDASDECVVAGDRGSRSAGIAEATESEGDEMRSTEAPQPGEGGWKERAEQAESEVARLRAEVGTLSGIIQAVSGLDSEPRSKADAYSTPNCEPQDGASPTGADQQYAALKRRILADPAILVALDAVRPEMQINITRPVLEMDAGTLKGRVALLVHEGFFKQPRPAGEVLRECQRRGWLTQNNRSNHLAPPLAELTELGFLTREDSGYQAVPGMKITAKESR
jgi:hypothetical protein